MSVTVSVALKGGTVAMVDSWRPAARSTEDKPPLPRAKKSTAPPPAPVKSTRPNWPPGTTSLRQSPHGRGFT
jgi:hypothetical protein